MIEIQCARYNSVPKETIERDVYYVIQILTEMGALSNESNPFFQKIKKRLENNYLIVNSPYSYYLKLRNFIGEKTSIERYRNPISNENLISSLVNSRFFSEPVQGYYFHVLKDERVVGVIIWGSIIPTIYSLEYISFFAVDDDTLKESIEASIELLNKISQTKNNFSIQFDEKGKSSIIFNLFKNNKLLLLKSEYDLNKDIIEVTLS